MIDLFDVRTMNLDFGGQTTDVENNCFNIIP